MTNGSEMIYDVMNWLTQISRCNFWNNSKTPLYDIIKPNISFSKQCLACNGCLRYLPKLKGGLELAFGVHFLHNFPIKIFLI